MEYTIGTKVFRDWEIVAEIGEGSYGKVYQLRKENFGIVANGALKVIRIPRSHSDVKDALSQGMDEQSVTTYFKGVVDEFMREVAVMSDMKSHPNVVGCQDYDIIPHVGGVGWDILIRMDLLTPLQEYQTKHTMDEAQVRQLGMDLCEALVHCQKRGLIHRDIKPGNIFVDELGRFRLGDFGVARTADKTMGGMSKQGTENYMAPEVYSGKEYGPTVDIYSLGMVLYQLMNANRLPFYPLPPAPIEFSHRFEVLKKRMSGDRMPPPCQASEDFAAVILKACSFESKDRYRTAADLLEAFKGAPAAAPSFTYSVPTAAPQQPVSEPFAPAPPQFSFNTPTGDETIGPAFAPRAPKAEPQPAAPFVSIFNEAPKASQEPAQQNASQFQLMVEDAFNIPGRGVVVTGYVCGAAVCTGDAITIVRKNGAQRAATVSGVEHNRQIIDSAQPGTAVGILLSGMSVQDVGAGDKLVGKASGSAFISEPVPAPGQSAPSSETVYVAVELGEAETKIACLEPGGEIRTLILPSALGWAYGQWCVGEEAINSQNSIWVLNASNKQRKELTGRDMSIQESLELYFEQLLQFAARNGMGSVSSDGTNRITTQIDVIVTFTNVLQVWKEYFQNACRNKQLGTPCIFARSAAGALRHCTRIRGIGGAERFLLCYLGADRSEVANVSWDNDVCEIIKTTTCNSLNAAALTEALEKAGNAREEALQALVSNLVLVMKKAWEGEVGPMPKVVLSGELATKTQVREQLARQLGMQPIVMENPFTAAAEGGAVRSAGMHGHPRFSSVLMLNATTQCYGVVDGAGKCLLKIPRDTTIPVKKSAKFHADEQTGELYLTEGVYDSPQQNPRIGTCPVKFLGEGTVELNIELDSIVRWQTAPGPNVTPRTRRTAKQAQSAAQAQPGNYAQIVKQVLARHPYVTPGKGYYHEKSLEKLRVHLGIPSDELVLLAHDDTLLKNGKDGFALTRSGIYARELLEKAVFTDWNTFAREKLDGARVDGKTVYYFTGPGRQELEQFFEDLHRTMKKAL